MNHLLRVAALFAALAPVVASAEPTKISVTIDRGRDLGQSLGSLFHAAAEKGGLVIGAGFQNAYNTRYRADRHAVQFFVRPTSGKREITVEELPRPSDNLTGAYLFARDGVVYSTFGGLKTWDEKEQLWREAKDVGGTHESMRLGGGQLKFGNSTVTYNGRTILDPPGEGSYQLFFYANGHLCFYHVNRRGQPYHLYKSDEDGFSRLYACPWTPKEPRVDLTKAVVLRLPVVGETTFAWGQLGRQIVTGSNIGGFYVFEDRAWQMLLEPQLGTSYQLYSTLILHDMLLMGQYPTGRLFQYSRDGGGTITDLKGSPPVLKGVSGSAREAQTTVLYGGDLMVGVWPWAELWRFNPDGRRWIFQRRMFDHPELSDAVTHPYDLENRGDTVGNRWGQRVTSLVINGPDLFIATSAKAPYKWEPEKFPFLAPDKWKSYGKVYRATMPGHLSAPTKWTEGPTTLEFIIDGAKISIHQDGELLATTTTTGELAARLTAPTLFGNFEWGDGYYGRFGGKSISGKAAKE